MDASEKPQRQRLSSSSSTSAVKPMNTQKTKQVKSLLESASEKAILGNNVSAPLNDQSQTFGTTTTNTGVSSGSVPIRKNSRVDNGIAFSRTNISNGTVVNTTKSYNSSKQKK